MDALNKLKSATTVAGIFQALLPGESEAVRRLRSDALDLSGDVVTRGALIIGNPGTGKSTLARAIALGRYASILRSPRVSEVLKSMSLDGPARLSTRNMDWYRELSLTGLVENLAASQLFGIAKGTATGVTPKDGLFRQAMHGGPLSEGQSATAAATITGGVVFLNEIGDLPAPLQPMLLTVLTGAQVYPVGSEGHADRGFSFHGLTIAATWRDIDSIRPDLLARLSDHVIRVPSLADRLDDLPEIVRGVIDETRRIIAERVKRLTDLPYSDIDKHRFASQEPAYNISSSDLDRLGRVDWTTHGDIRGLGQILHAVMQRGRSVADAIAEHESIRRQEAGPRTAEILLEEIQSEARPDRSLVSAVSAAEQRLRCDVAGLLLQDDGRFEALAEALGLNHAALKKQLSDLQRDRKRRS